MLMIYTQKKVKLNSDLLSSFLLAETKMNDLTEISENCESRTS